MVRRFLVLIMCCLMTVTLFGCVYNMGNLPEGELLETYSSPNNTYTLKIYLCNGGATVDYSIRGELVNEIESTSKNIYWSYHENNAVVEWKDENTVIINGRILNVLEDIYDFRNEP